MTRPDETARLAQHIERDEKPVYRPPPWAFAAAVIAWIVVIGALLGRFWNG